MTDKIVIENNAKDEILSYATTLEIIENEKTYAKKHGINFNINDTPEKLFFQEVKKELINEDGSYYSKYKKVYILNSPQLIEDYKKRVCEAIEAYSHLTELYKDIFPNKTNRMAIDVLVQFPLVKWPAIVRLIETRKKNRK